MNEFTEFPKIARLSRECIITEKLDGTNASLHIGEDGSFLIGSRTRFITPQDDNYGFAAWAMGHKDELMTLGPGVHYGEWWGQGVQRKYGMSEKRFSLFNTSRWHDETERPACCYVVPILYAGVFDMDSVLGCLDRLRLHGSTAAPGFMNPEGVIVWHTAARIYFKKTLDKDDEYKGKSKC